MREDGVNRLQAKIKKVVLSKNLIDSTFVKLLNRRDIRNSVVNKLCSILEKGSHFETPIMTNRINNKDRLIDGNHRIEAISKYLNKYPNRKVEVNIFYYENLTEQEERKVYTKWNLGTKQNTNDFVKQYWDVIPITKYFDDKKYKFPCNVSHIWQKNSIEFKTLVGAYLTKDNEKFSGGFSGSAVLFIEKAKNLKIEDFHIIKNFLEEFIDVFGVPDRKNAHYRQAIFYSIMRIWLDNYKTNTPNQIRNAFIRLRGHERVIYYQSMGGTREVTYQCRIDILNVLNGRKKSNLFI